MKFCVSLVLALFALTAFTPPAHAIVSSANAISIVASSGATTGTMGATAGTVKSSAWRTVVSSAAKALKGIYIYNSSPVSLQVAVGPSGSEVMQMIVPPGTLPGGAYNGSPVGSYQAGVGQFYPIAISQGTKVAIEAVESDAAQGQIIVTEFFY